MSPLSHPCPAAAAASVGGADAPPAPSRTDIDILGLLEHWVDLVAACSRCVKDMAGRSGAVTPLSATADAHSHAPHLRALLAAHTAATQQQSALQGSLAADIVAAGVYLPKAPNTLHYTHGNRLHAGRWKAPRVPKHKLVSKFFCLKNTLCTCPPF